MSLLDLIPALSPPETLTAGPADQSAPRDHGAGRQNGFDRGRWNGVIDTLLEWERDPAALEDEGVDPPTREIARRAICLAEYLRDRQLPAPERIVPDANGGIAFEWFQADTTESIEIAEGGSIEYLRFEGGRLTKSEALSFPGPADGE